MSSSPLAIVVTALAATVLAGPFACAAEAVRVGDLVIVTAESADATWGGRVIAHIPRGGAFRVLQVRSDAVSGWIKIRNREDLEWTKRGHEIGWVRRDQVELAKPGQVDPEASAVARAIPDGSPAPRPSEEKEKERKAVPSPSPRLPLPPPPSLSPSPPLSNSPSPVTAGPSQDGGGHFACRTFSGASRELCAAISDRRADEVWRLLAAKANINARSERSHTQGMTLLQVAVWHEWGLDKIQLLLRAGADANATDGRGRTALMLAAAKEPAIDAALVRLLLAAGADVNAKDHRGMTALMYAAMHDDFSVVKMLIEAGANVRARDAAGWTALMHAVRKHCGHAAVVQLLVRAGGEVNAAHHYGGTALSIAAYHGHAQAIETLLQAGAQVNADDTSGWTPLICACTGGHAKVAARLLAAGADPRAKDRLGRTPLSIASENGMTGTAVLLVQAGGK